MDSPVGWVGTESGLPGGKEIWSTGGTDGTAKDSEVWMPKACDTTLQMGVSRNAPPCPIRVFESPWAWASRTVVITVIT